MEALSERPPVAAMHDAEQMAAAANVHAITLHSLALRGITGIVGAHRVEQTGDMPSVDLLQASIPGNTELDQGPEDTAEPDQEPEDSLGESLLGSIALPADSSEEETDSEQPDEDLIEEPAAQEPKSRARGGSSGRHKKDWGWWGGKRTYCPNCRERKREPVCHCNKKHEDGKAKLPVIQRLREADAEHAKSKKTTVARSAGRLASKEV